MPRISIPVDLDELEDDDMFGTFERFTPSRKPMDPVSGRHDLQRRAECGVNRHRKNKEVRV